jgi:hypothetical protein
MRMLVRGLLLRLASDMVVVVLERVSRHGWNCLCIKGPLPYAGQDIFVFDEDLKKADLVLK